MPHHSGRLEVICGSMFSGKSEELIRRARRAEYARLPIQIFKHQLDQRKTVDHVHAHSGDKIGALAAQTALDIRQLLLPETEVIAIDEVQFFDAHIVELITELVAAKKRVIVAGLDVDFRTVPFGCMPALMAIADDVTKLNAVCLICGKDARFTQRLVDGKPAKCSDPLVLIGAQDCYQARCRDCYELAP